MLRLEAIDEMPTEWLRVVGPAAVFLASGLAGGPQGLRLPFFLSEKKG